MKLTGKVIWHKAWAATVISQSLVGVVLETRKFPQVTKVYGAVNGVEGIV